MLRQKPLVRFPQMAPIAGLFEKCASAQEDRLGNDVVCRVFGEESVQDCQGVSESLLVKTSLGNPQEHRGDEIIRIEETQRSEVLFAICG